jgi:crotonobetainyl-CoA:carnitine CoA-transferase CaiB-like acyl-CoA transferase
MSADDRAGPLVGMRVIDLSHVMAGPVCGLMLADMGADVIKVEKVDGGDDSRRMLPPDINGEPAAFMMMNRNKRGVALDLKHDKGKEILKRLVATADVLIENYRRGTMQRLGLDYEKLKAINPGLIYCEISGFGRTGPLADSGGFDLVAQAMSGLMAITGEGPGRPPVKIGAPVTDITAGILAAMGVCAAYSHKLKTGAGQRVDTSLFEAGIIHTYWQSAICFATGISPGPLGSAHPLSAPYQAFETKDGWIVVGGSNQANWERMVKVMDAETLARDPCYKDNKARMTHLPELVDELNLRFRQKTAGEWLALFEAAGVPAGPVMSIDEMHRHPQTIARAMVPMVKHPLAGEVQTLGLPVKFSETPGNVARAAPLFGQHTRQVLAELGYRPAEIDNLISVGAAKAADVRAMSAVQDNAELA